MRFNIEVDTTGDDKSRLLELSLIGVTIAEVVKDDTKYVTAFKIDSGKRCQVALTDEQWDYLGHTDAIKADVQ